MHQQTAQNKIQVFPYDASLRAQTLLYGVVAPCHQCHRSGGVVENKVPQLHTTKSEPLD